MRSNMDKQTNIAAKRKAAELGPSSCLIHERRRTEILGSSQLKKNKRMVHMGDVRSLHDAAA
jgi:hypothetical protein